MTKGLIVTLGYEQTKQQLMGLNVAVVLLYLIASGFPCFCGTGTRAIGFEDGDFCCFKLSRTLP